MSRRVPIRDVPIAPVDWRRVRGSVDSDVIGSQSKERWGGRLRPRWGDRTEEDVGVRRVLSVAPKAAGVTPGRPSVSVWESIMEISDTDGEEGGP